MKKVFLGSLVIFLSILLLPVDWDAASIWVIVPVMILFVLSALILGAAVIGFIMMLVDPHA